MNYKLVLRITLPVIIVLGLILAFFNITHINVFEVNASLGKKDTEPILSTHNIKTLFIVDKAFLTSRKINGQLNALRPDYILEINRIGKKKETLYLWLKPNTTKSMYAKYDNNDRDYYHLSEKSTEELKKIILKNNK